MLNISLLILFQDEAKFQEKLAKLQAREVQFNKVISKIDHAQVKQACYVILIT